MEIVTFKRGSILFPFLRMKGVILKSNKIIEHQRKKIGECQEIIRNQKKEISLLDQKNKALSNAIDDLKTKFEILTVEHDKALSTYNEGLNKIKNMLKENRKVVFDAKIARKNNDNETSILLDSLRKQIQKED